MRKPFSALPGALFIVGALFLSGSAMGQSYVLTTSFGTMQSIQTTGSSVIAASVDDGSGTISVPFSFEFFGQVVTAGSSIYANSNGTLNIYDQYSDYGNTTIPSVDTPNGFIAPYWDDLRTSETGGVFYQVEGGTGSQILIIEWQASSYDDSAQTASWQIKIYETTNLIEILYGPQSTDTSVWIDGTIGVEDMNGASGASLPCGVSCSLYSDVPPGTLLVFTPSTAPPPQPDLAVNYVQAPPTTMTEGQSVTLDFQVDNLGSGNSGSTEIGLYIGTSPTVTTNDYMITSENISSIVAGDYYSSTFYGSIPSGSSGTYYLAAIVDPYNSVSESSETNNTYSMGSVTVSGSSNDIVITTSSLPQGQVGVFYSYQLAQSGATSPYWTIISGTPPPGITLSGSGLLSGTPTTDGSSSFNVEASESGLNSGTANLSLTIGNSGGVSITTTSLPPANVGVPYNATLTATGGSPPYAFQIISGRPDWLMLSSSGELTGTPTGVGTHQLGISVFDSNSADAVITLELSVTQAGPLAVNTNIPNGVQNRPYTTQVISGGMPPYTVSVTNGSFPDNLQIDGMGVLSGMPTSAGSWTVEFSVTDSATPQGSAQGSVALTVTELRQLSIPFSEISVTIRTDVNHQMQPDGGVPPYIWSVLTGQLPLGLAVNQGGLISGRVEETSTATVTFNVVDNEGSNAQAQVFIRVGTPDRPTSTGRGSGAARSQGCNSVEIQPQQDVLTFFFLLVGLVLIPFRRRAQPKRSPDEEA